VQCTYAMKFSAAADGNFSEVLTQFENDCAQSISLQAGVKQRVKLLSRRENLREPADPAMLR